MNALEDYDDCSIDNLVSPMIDPKSPDNLFQSVSPDVSQPDLEDGYGNTQDTSVGEPQIDDDVEEELKEEMFPEDNADFNVDANSFTNADAYAL
ncbi:hypothetical protein HK098_006120 [Nowakowskiella sp. JEL0407]|nr:hypothetical protein HK098_006120 [Nowakowskiella sp. JEL0407]